MLTSQQLQEFSKQAKQVQSTPFMLTNLELIRQKYQDFKTALPKVKVYYALKSFSDDEVVKVLDNLVEGFDVASFAEVEQLTKLKISPKRMVFSNPVKSRPQIAGCFRLGVNRFAFQSEAELHKLAEHAPGSEVYVRILVPNQHSELSFSSKFGIPPNEAADLMLKAKTLGLLPIGITFNAGSQANDASGWQRGLEHCGRICNTLQDAGISISFINIGGGYPVQYASDDTEFKTIADKITQSITSADLENVNIIAEPGRFLVADSSCIVSTIIGIEKRGEKRWLFIDTGAFQSFVEIFEFQDFPYPVHSLKHLMNPKLSKGIEQFAITGPSCDSYDTLTKNYKLPGDLEVGDRLMISMAGAYTVVYGSNFNGFEVPPRIFFN